MRATRSSGTLPSSLSVPSLRPESHPTVTEPAYPMHNPWHTPCMLCRMAHPMHTLSDRPEAEWGVPSATSAIGGTHGYGVCMGRYARNAHLVGSPRGRVEAAVLQNLPQNARSHLPRQKDGLGTWHCLLRVGIGCRARGWAWCMWLAALSVLPEDERDRQSQAGLDLILAPVLGHHCHCTRHCILLCHGRATVPCHSRV